MPLHLFCTLMCGLGWGRFRIDSGLTPESEWCCPANESHFASLLVTHVSCSLRCWSTKFNEVPSFTQIWVSWFYSRMGGQILKGLEHFNGMAMGFYRTLQNSHISCSSPLILKRQFILVPLFEALNEWMNVNVVVDMTQCTKRCPNKFYWCIFKWALYVCSKFTCTIWLQQYQSLLLFFPPSE